MGLQSLCKHKLLNSAVLLLMGMQAAAVSLTSESGSDTITPDLSSKEQPGIISTSSTSSRQ